ncbi:hypothetical protein [Psychromonas marina]|nr:hypothetical protein [Psychromonas marina]
MSSFSLASIETLAQVKKGKNEVKVQKIGESACTLNYKSGDHLTTEGAPVFYTFQVEVAEGEIQRGMLSSIPHSIKPNRNITLSFYDRYDKNIYEYSGEVSQYGQIFYSTNLYLRFLRSKKTLIRQGNVAANMPLYSQVNIPNSVKNKFENCVSNLKNVLQKYCASSTSATKQCEVNQQRGTKAFAGLIIKEDPVEVAKAAQIAKLKEQEKAAQLAKLKEQKKAAQLAKRKELEKAAKLKEQKKAAQMAKLIALEKAAQTAKVIELEKVGQVAKVMEQEKQKTPIKMSRKDFMAACNNPTINERGPIKKQLYIRGNFKNTAWGTDNKRAFKYKGNNIYQVVINEKAGRYQMQYASKDWSLQFTANYLALEPAVENSLKKGYYEQNTTVALPESGKYVWSLQFSESGAPQKILVSLCK